MSAARFARPRYPDLVACVPSRSSRGEKNSLLWRARTGFPAQSAVSVRPYEPSAWRASAGGGLHQYSDTATSNNQKHSDGSGIMLGGFFWFLVACIFGRKLSPRVLKKSNLRARPLNRVFCCPSSHSVLARDVAAVRCLTVVLRPTSDRALLTRSGQSENRATG